MSIHRIKRPAPLVIDVMSRQPRAEVSADGVYREGSFEISRNGIISEGSASSGSTGSSPVSPNNGGAAQQISTAVPASLQAHGGAGAAGAEGGSSAAATLGTTSAGHTMRFEDFNIIKVLGKGSGGIVHLAVHKKTGLKVAMKTVSVVVEKKKEKKNQSFPFRYTNCPFRYKWPFFDFFNFSPHQCNGMK